MNADFEYRHPSSDLDAEAQLSSSPESNTTAVRASLAPERFELLSAYLDGEASPAQRKQVESWLDTDPGVQRLYTQMLRLRETMKSLPIPALATPDPNTLANQVFAQVDRQPRVLVVWAGVGAAIAATCVAVVSGLVVGNRSFVPQMANSTTKSPESVAFSPAPATGSSAEGESLMIGLDQPVVDIPRATLVQWNNPSNN